MGKISMLMCLRVLLLLSTSLAVPLVALADEQAHLEFFENRIRPVLIQHCYECHSADSKTVKGELRVDHP